MTELPPTPVMSACQAIATFWTTLIVRWLSKNGNFRVFGRCMDYQSPLQLANNWSNFYREKLSIRYFYYELKYYTLNCIAITRTGILMSQKSPTHTVAKNSENLKNRI